MKHKLSEGFTLTEVMVAMLVLGIGLGSALIAMGTAIQWVRINRAREFALHANREAIETVGGWGLSSLTNRSPSIATMYGCDTSYALSFSAQPLGGPGLPSFRVTATTVWTNPVNGAGAITNTMQTIMARPLH